MNTLFVTEMFPYPLDTGGNVRTFNLLKGLASEHRVTLVATTRGEVEPQHLDAVREFCEQIRLVPVERPSPVKDLRMLAGSLLSAQPFVLVRHRYRAVRDELKALLRQGDARFDVVHFNHLDAAMYAADMPSTAKRVLDQHNVVANQVRTTLANERHPLRNVLLRYELKKLQSYEAALCNQMQRCLACSQADAESLQQMGVVADTAVIPNGVDLDYFRPVPLESTSAREVVFLGTLDYDPCERAVWYFCTEILPLIRRTIPDLRFVAVGRNPSQRLQDLAAADPLIVLTGRVEDVRTHVQRARAFAVPLLAGSGTRLKILEAMAMGIPVVSTTIGAEGLDVNNGEHAWIADTPADFAAAVIRVLTDLPQAREMSHKARLLVEALYGWPAICRKLLDEYRSVAA